MTLGSDSVGENMNQTLEVQLLKTIGNISIKELNRNPILKKKTSDLLRSLLELRPDIPDIKHMMQKLGVDSI